MPRPRNALPSRKLNTALPADIWAKLDLQLYSEAEQRVPFGAHQKFLVSLLKDYFERQSIDLGQHFPDRVMPGTRVYGDASAIHLLTRILTEGVNV